MDVQYDTVSVARSRLKQQVLEKHNNVVERGKFYEMPGRSAAVPSDWPVII